jgi:CheY-like chemotaxis protein
MIITMKSKFLLLMIYSFNFLAKVLQNNNIQILYAKNGLDAVEMVREHPDIELVLMDIRMPVMDGLEATKRIKNIKPELPVIAQTAYAFSQEKDKILSMGCDDYISKPIDINKLLRLIDKYLKNSLSDPEILRK